ncbi:NAD-glutamate dehydrogenase [Marihabitans asiaticum]|uniref:Glutamate dehydrogenase n=1 Tax=Marihabitans asiaticum TaxID=415218 RepID=A0A560W889_9MICO|nr:NAD-glutamate dehydrogenase [Marihabitans asiaticum]TWD13831.1 glutamate dehydrogenase [Marihabitans asiaticum]
MAPLSADSTSAQDPTEDRSDSVAVEQAARLAADAGEDPPFVRRYLRHVEAEVGDRSAEELLAMATAHRELAARRAPGETLVAIDGGTLRVVTDDRPFLVDSVRGALEGRGHRITAVVHPQLCVARDADGRLQEITDLAPDAEADSGVAESWMRFEVAGSGLEQSDGEAMVRSVLDEVEIVVQDWQPMRARVQELAERIGEGGDERATESADFLRWVAQDHMLLLGVRDFTVDGDAMEIVAGSGLGTLTGDERKLSDAERGLADGERGVWIGKGSSRATVHRVAYPDHVAVRWQGPDGQVQETRIVGLFTSSAYTEPVLSIPVLQRKIDHILQSAGWSRDSHSGARVLRLLETFPRDELFQSSAEHLEQVVHEVLRVEGLRQTALFLRGDGQQQFVSALVYLPRDRYTTPVRQRIEEVLSEAIGADEATFTAKVSEDSLARLSYVLRREDGAAVHVPSDAELAALRTSVAEASRSWTEMLQTKAVELLGRESAEAALAPFVDGYPLDYQGAFTAAQAVADLKNAVRIDEEHRYAGVLYDPQTGHDVGPQVRRFKLFSIDRVSLADIMPVFRDLGVEVIDEEPYILTRSDGERIGVYDFGLKVADAQSWQQHSHEELRDLVEGVVAAVWSGRAESDALNALVVGAGLTWREVALLRTIAKYLKQTRATWSLRSLAEALVSNPGIATDLVALFTARFDPDAEGDEGARAEAQAAVRERIETALDDVASLEQDRVIRAFVGVIAATLRTSYYQVDEAGEPLPRISLKLEPAKVPDLPKPWPAFEIWVCSPQVEGVHLRFGLVARGGLRWSDRRDDFRTEVLGLVKAQMVKNAVIVPTGSKGGFVGKQLPDPAEDREAWMEAGRSAYVQFISGLLDVTDNRVDGEIVAPERVVRHDGDDPYLVVAADKGTATFSDLANSVALDYGFWLGDAFASGGSIGYDHKGMGITARGAWESVKRHFREMGHDTQTEDFTVVGIGDMSGDVFGNGMLLSEHIRLVAGFDHRHIFIDPDPDAASSYPERRRLFDLGRSSWDDYDRDLISDGGGVWPRTAKSIDVSEQAARALGLDGPTAMTPTELIHAILRAPVDLLWNGGIGTYIKATSESHDEVGDRAGDAYRVNGDQLRVRVVGEGGNLGATQRGRIEAARHGVRINTDAIDNSAGVDTSDHEVNIKILLGEVVRDGGLDEDGRVELLASMTDEVARMVLRDNYEQNVLLGNARSQGGSMLPVHETFMRALVARGELDRELEFLPSQAEVEHLEHEGLGLSSPELSVLLAYSKLALKNDLLESATPDDEALEGLLLDYFPDKVRQAYPDQARAHPLRREIVTTVLANEVVNRGGITFVHRACDETGATSEQVARAFVASRDIFRLQPYVRAVEALDNEVPTEVQTRLYLEFRRLMDRSVRWFLAARSGRLAIRGEVERFAPVVEELGPQVVDLLQGSEAERLRQEAGVLQRDGVPEELAVWTASLLDQYSLLDITDIAADTGLTPGEVAAVYYLVSEQFRIDDLLHRVTALPRAERWDSLARGALRDDLYATLQSLTRSVLDASSELDSPEPDERFATWLESHDESWQRVRNSLAGIRALPTPTVAALSVALRTLRSVTR